MKKLNLPRFSSFSEIGEIATILTLATLVIMVGGIFLGTKLIKNPVRVTPKAATSCPAGCNKCATDILGNQLGFCCPTTYRAGTGGDGKNATDECLQKYNTTPITNSAGSCFVEWNQYNGPANTCTLLSCSTLNANGWGSWMCQPAISPTPRLTTVNIQSSITNYVPGYTVTISQQKSTATTPTTCGAATQVAVVGAITNFQSTCSNLTDGSYTFTTVVKNPAGQTAGQVSSPLVTVPFTVGGNLYIQPALILPVAPPNLCQSTAISGSLLSTSTALKITSTANISTVTKFTYTFYNSDNRDSAGIPKPIQFVSGQNYIITETAASPTNSHVIIINYTQFDRPDLNNGGVKPVHIQANAQFTDPVTGVLSSNNASCVEFFNIAQPPSPTLTPVPLPTINTPTPTRTPTPAIRWTINAEARCSNGSVPSSNKVTFVNYQLWDLITNQQSSLSDGQKIGLHTVTITAPSSNTNVYFWLLNPGTSPSTGLTPIGTPFHTGVTYGNVYGMPYQGMQWNSSALPSGTYSVQFQAPASWCTTSITPTPTPVTHNVCQVVACTNAVPPVCTYRCTAVSGTGTNQCQTVGASCTPSSWLRSDIVVNGKVDIFDFNAMVSDFGCPSRLSPACAANWNIADIIQNGKVDIFDYNAMVSDFGCPSRTSPVCT